MVDSKQPLEQCSVSEQVEYLIQSIENSNGLEPEFTSTEQIKVLQSVLTLELYRRAWMGE